MNSQDRKYLDALVKPLHEGLGRVEKKVDSLVPTVASHGATISNLRVAIGAVGGFAALGMLAITAIKYLG